MSVSPLPARGEMWWCELPDVGRRPVVVLSRDAAIPRLKRTLVLAVGGRPGAAFSPSGWEEKFLSRGLRG